MGNNPIEQGSTSPLRIILSTFEKQLTVTVSLVYLLTERDFE